MCSNPRSLQTSSLRKLFGQLLTVANQITGSPQHSSLHSLRDCTNHGISSGMPKHTRRPPKSKLQLTNDQLSFDLGLVDEFPTSKTKSVSDVEILPPQRVITTHFAVPISEGVAEHAFLTHRSDKYEERALRALIPFIISACLAVFVKGGIPVSQAVLEKLGLPAVDNVRLLAGMLGAATVIFAGVLVYYSLRCRQFSPQLQLPMARPNILGRAADAMYLCGVILLITMFAAVIYLTGRDIFYMATYLWDHSLYIVEGWGSVTHK